MKNELGPFDDQPWPEKLKAHVVTPGAQPRIHGYDAEGDLARHYPFAQTVLLALTGELPTEEASRAFEVALQFLAPASVADAPAHAAVIGKVCAGTTSALIGTGALALAEEARFVVAQYAEWIQWLEGSDGKPPAAQFSAANGDDRASVGRLSVALKHIPFVVPALTHDLSRDAAVIAALHACGLTRAEQIEIAMVFAKLPVLMAEAMAAPTMGFRQYPMNLPRFQYEAP